MIPCVYVHRVDVAVVGTAIITYTLANRKADVSKLLVDIAHDGARSVRGYSESTQTPLTFVLCI